DRHQVDRIERLEDSIGLVTRGQRIEMIRDSRQRGVTAILDSADEAAHLFHVFPRLVQAWTAKLVGVGRFWQELLDQVRGRNAIDKSDPCRRVTAYLFERAPVVVLELRHGYRQYGAGDRSRETRRERRKGVVREADKTGSQESRGPEFRRG